MTVSLKSGIPVQRDSQAFAETVMNPDSVLILVCRREGGAISKKGKKMDLSRYDGQCVRVIDDEGNVFDGICTHNSREYCMHEFGRDEECLQIEGFLLFPSYIVSVESLEGNSGPYGRFLDPYGDLERMTVQDGLDSIQEALDSEEGEHVVRLLRCLSDYIVEKRDAVWRDQLPDVLRGLLDSNGDEEVQTAAKEVLERLEGP